MPQSARKSSIGRRAAQKNHLPFRADDLQHGKKTGMVIDGLMRRSDEFEDFHQLLGQADQRSSLNSRGKPLKKDTRVPSPIIQYDENGEMSMEIEENNAGGPVRYFSNAAQPTAPPSVNRAGSSRLVPRASHIDFDQVPSPRATSFLHSRRSFANGSTAGPSRLSQPIPDSDPPDGGGMDGVDNDFDQGNYDRPENSSPVRRMSFTQMDRDDDDDDGEQRNAVHVQAPVTPPRRDKGKGRVIEPEDNDDEIEDNIAHGLHDIQMESDYDNQDPGPANKKPKATKEIGKKSSRQKNSVIELGRGDSPTNTTGLRRGTRVRIAPLDFWRLEHVVYGRRDSGITLVPQIKAIVRVPKEDPQPLGKRKRRRTVKKPEKEEEEEEEDGEEGQGEVIAYNPEEGWDDTTNPQGVVIDYVTKEEVERRLAFTAKMITPKPAANNDFEFQKVFGDGDFIAAGQLTIPPGKQKPSKSTKDNSYVFYIIEGAVQFKVHRTSFVLATGSMFLVPRGNTYFIENISQRDAKLFFAQARKVPFGEGELPPDIQPPSANSRRSSDPQRPSSGSVPRIQRSSSAGPPPKIYAFTKAASKDPGAKQRPGTAGP